MGLADKDCLRPVLLQAQKLHVYGSGTFGAVELRGAAVPRIRTRRLAPAPLRASLRPPGSRPDPWQSAVTVLRSTALMLIHIGGPVGTLFVRKPRILEA